VKFLVQRCQGIKEKEGEGGEKFLTLYKEKRKVKLMEKGELLLVPEEEKKKKERRRARSSHLPESRKRKKDDQKEGPKEEFS